MKKILLALALTVLAATTAYSETLTFQWTPEVDTSNIDGLRIYKDNWENPVGDFDPTTGEGSLTADLNGNCSTFWATYFNATDESDKSDEATVCAGSTVIPMVGGFTITVTPN